MKRIICVLIAAALLIMLCGCGEPAAEEDGKIQIVASLFPQNDFARTIAGDRAEVTLLLPAGMESHTYDPTPADMAKIYSCDLFLYTGELMEPWAAALARGLDEGTAVDLSSGVTLGGVHEAHDHDHEGEESEHVHTSDPHIWTSPLNAKIMVENILDALISLDPEGEDEYRAAAEEYLAELDLLDAELRDAAESAERNTLAFGGRFAFYYLAEEYGFECISAYDSCSAETEPSAAAVAELTEAIVREGIPVIFHEELANPQVAQAIADETGAELRLLHSCHNLSADERAAGETYLSIMARNIENIRAALN